MVLNNITYFPIAGIPFIVYLGIITLIIFLFTAAIAIMNRRGYNKIPMVWHFRFAYVSIALAILHGILGLLAYF
jgi:uncharacterized membrane protein